LFHEENDSVDDSHSPIHTHNSLCGGTCRLEIMSTPNDEVLEGDFPVVATMLNCCSHIK